MMKSFVLQIVLFLSLVIASSHAQGSTTVMLEPAADGLMKVHASVAGHEGTFLFDSGSGFSSISPEFAAAIGCHPWGQITGFRMTGDRLDMPRCDNVVVSLAGKSFTRGTMGVFDLSKYLPAEVGHIDGTIALDLFADQAFTFSYAGHFLRLLDPPALARQIGGLRPMPIHIVRDAEGMALTVNLPVATSAGTAWFEMDSGNTSGMVLVNEALASLFPLKSGGKSDSTVSLRIQDGTTFTGPARVLSLILDGNLGTSFLSRHDITIDLTRKTAWVHFNVPTQ